MGNVKGILLVAMLPCAIINLILWGAACKSILKGDEIFLDILKFVQN